MTLSQRGRICAVLTSAMLCTGGQATAGSADETRFALSALTFEPVGTGQDRPTRAPWPVPVQAEPAIHINNIAGSPGESVPVDISTTGLHDADHMIFTFRGLPEAVSLSSGFKSSDTWFISYKDAQSLSLTAQKGYEGEFEVRVDLLRGKNVKPLSRIIRVIISGQTPPAVASQDSDGSDENDNTASIQEQTARQEVEIPTVTTTLSNEKESQLMAVAESMLKQKDIAAARVVYARLARLGSADAAYMLAQSYDPAYLAQMQITGLKPEPDKAKQWYGVAAGLGNSEAPGRLSALEEAGW